MSEEINMSPLPPVRRTPDFDNLLAVFHREKPKRDTLYELFLNHRLYRRFCEPNHPALAMKTDFDFLRVCVSAFARAGYDYSYIDGPFDFARTEIPHGRSISMNASVLIYDRASFEAYPWPDPDKAYYSKWEKILDEMPPKMKLVSKCPHGVLESVMNIVGYENLCLMAYDDPGLLEDIFARIGKTLVRHQEIVSAFPSVGACMCNDDWGHHTQTVFSPEMMGKYIFPWHQKMIDAIHKNGKPALLHSCGNLTQIMDTIVTMGYDMKHSFEDSICPVEEMYDQWSDKISIVGGIDVDFICTKSLDEITERSRKMLRKAAARGGYALGTGNSVADYISDERYLAMTKAALEND